MIDHIKTKYKASPEYLWMRFPAYAVFRHADNEKWFAIVMDIPAAKLGLPGEETVEILNVKLSDPFLADMLTQQPGYFKGYHISRGSWVSVLLDGTVPFEEICLWLEESYLTTASKEELRLLRPPKEWIVPANPKYYDVEAAFSANDEIDWKQGAGIKKGDTVYLYVAAPVSAILYRCLVTQTDIPFRYNDGRIRMKALMKIKLRKRYPADEFTFDTLKAEYGVTAIRGPRGLPPSLSEALKQ